MIEERFADRDVAYVEVSDLGVDAYAASPAAAADFPFWPSSARAAFAIGRRLLNPLEEYLKVPPALLCDDGFCNRKMNAKAIKDAVAKVEVRCVNEVGVELNRASFDVLRCICGLNPLSAQNIVERRKTLGAFRNREELKTVAGISDAAFELCAGFLKIVGGDEPLDATWIHPESYDLARKILGKLGFATEDLAREDKRALIAESVEKINLEELAKEFDAGPKLVADILAEFVNPGADARDKRPGPAFKRAPIKIESLAVGTKLVGVVTSVAEFGAFVDVGASILGLVHISELSARARDARQIVSVGDPMTVWVRSVDIKGSRLSLTAVSPDAPRDKPRAIRNDKKARDGERPDRSQDRRKPRDAENAVANRDSRDGERTRRPRREGDSENAAKRDRPPRRNDRNRDDRDRPPRSAQVAPKEKEATP
ncbi:MAG: helix-hairpin-helix domain-containing protein, partial [Thermoguttaceae bacterium]|nr:helix-hairpin-helix domain-containing protein [Thermoguttaceae bacterium]